MFGPLAFALSSVISHDLISHGVSHRLAVGIRTNGDVWQMLYFLKFVRWASSLWKGMFSLYSPISCFFPLFVDVPGLHVRSVYCGNSYHWFLMQFNTVSNFAWLALFLDTVYATSAQKDIRHMNRIWGMEIYSSTISNLGVSVILTSQLRSRQRIDADCGGTIRELHISVSHILFTIV